MSDFPNNRYDALALIYVQSRDLSTLSPAEILDLYENARQEIKERGAERRSEAYNDRQK